MKGILYGKFLLNKSWFIASGIVAVLGTALCAVLNGFVPDDSGVPAMLLTGVQLVALALMTEWLGRDLEANIKCRFTDMTLAGGISKNMYVLTELVKNLLTIAAGAAVCVITQLVMNIFDNNILSWESVKTLLLFTLFIGAFEFALNPLIINLKSAEKAGLLFGLVLGFGIILPIMAVSGALEYDIVAYILKVSSSPWFAPAVAGLSAVIYALFYLVLLRRVKKGDVC